MLIDVYRTTTITSQRTAVIERDPKTKAAGRTPGTAPSASPSAARGWYVRVRTKRTLLTGIRNAHDPIMIGNAAAGFIPRRLTRIMHGAYRPMPSIIRTPRTKLTARPIDRK